MNRRGFLGGLTLISGLGLSTRNNVLSAKDFEYKKSLIVNSSSLVSDVLIVGAGLGGVAAALAALRNGESVILTEETDWIGGQCTQQAVPPDEHPWIETHGAPASYRTFRNEIRDYYRRFYPLSEEAKSKEFLNPGDGAVSRLCHEPRVALAVLEGMLAPYIANNKLRVLLNYQVTHAKKVGEQVQEVFLRHTSTQHMVALKANYFVDATELGDVLPLTNTAYVTGTESKEESGELHAPAIGNSKDNQSFTMVFAVDYHPGENHTIPKPKSYDFWRNYIPQIQPPWPGKLLSLTYSLPQTLVPKTLGFHPEGIPTGEVLNLWNYRRILSKRNFVPGFLNGDTTIINWPQNDYMLGNLIDVPKKEFHKHIDAAKQLSLSLLYWLQTEVERPDGGRGWPGLRLNKEAVGTADGLAKYPYIRESRRIKALFTIKEEHVGKEQRKLTAKANEDADHAAIFEDSVGIGYYHIDLHPSMHRNYVDFPSLPFQIPLGALIPEKTENLFPANKNIGTTHITNGCYRLHPVEWSIGEAVGLLIHFIKKNQVTAKQVREDQELLKSFQAFIQNQGVEIAWKQPNK